jgi:Na+/H+ antiporter NhaD/arsenite permease-like protein
VIALAVFVVTYVSFAIGRLPFFRSDRMAVAVIGGVAMVGAGVLSFDDAARAIDGSTLALLFGMMVLSTALEISGAFRLVAHHAARIARQPFTLLVLVSVTAALLSAVLINDVVCIAFTPMVLRIARAVKRDPKPYLIALATSSNIGSVATVTGNPQNILIASTSHLSYLEFARALGPVAVVCLAVNCLVLRIAFRDEMSGALDSVSSAKSPRVYRRWVWKGGLIMTGVLLAFVLGVPRALAALVGASFMLLTRAVHPRRLYQAVDFPLLILFAGLFVGVAGAERGGVTSRFFGFIAAHSSSLASLAAATAVLSNLVSNVPAVMALKSTVAATSTPGSGFLTLAMSATLAGNFTLTGSLASIIVVECARRDVRVTFWDFFKVGAPSSVSVWRSGRRGSRSCGERGARLRER